MDFDESTQNHENSADNPELKRPSQETVQTLLDEITSLTNLGAAHYTLGTAVGKSITMHETGSNIVDVQKPHAKTLALFRYTLHEDPAFIASITQAETIGMNGARLLTKYDVFETTNGLEVQKHIKDINIYAEREALQVSKTQEEIRQRIEEVKKNQAEEDALGLDFVSEAEVRLLVSMIRHDFAPDVR